MAFAKPGDTIMGMSLAEGGHLTHGMPLNMSGKWFNVVAYGLVETKKSTTTRWKRWPASTSRASSSPAPPPTRCASTS